MHSWCQLFIAKLLNSSSPLFIMLPSASPTTSWNLLSLLPLFTVSLPNNKINYFFLVEVQKMTAFHIWIYNFNPSTNPHAKLVTLYTTCQGSVCMNLPIFIKHLSLRTYTKGWLWQRSLYLIVSKITFLLILIFFFSLSSSLFSHML